MNVMNRSIRSRFAAGPSAMSRHGKTFHWASLLLGREAARRARVFYAFCRFADDAADELAPREARAALAGIAMDLDRGSSAVPAVDGFLDVARGCGVDLEPVRILLGAMEDDLQDVRLECSDQLLRYAYSVAGTVGLVMCDLLEVEDEDARPFAVDLGVAMQLTNIARDVLEDAERGRVYLPAEFLGCAVFAEEIVADEGDARERCTAAVERLLELAERYYESAEWGRRFLPRRARAAVMTASRCYAAIGAVVRRRIRQGTYWEGRAYVSRPVKLWRTLRAFASFLFDTRTHASDRPRGHAPQLHEALRGLPGTHLEQL